jgi:hypothetical protein
MQTVCMPYSNFNPFNPPNHKKPAVDWSAEARSPSTCRPGSILGMQDELDGRFAKALTMLSNSRDDMRALIGKANTGLTSLQLGVPQSAALPDQANQ